MEDYLTPEERIFIAEHKTEDATVLALKMKHGGAINSIRVLQQIAGYQLMAEKVPSWKAYDDLWYPSRLALEQCSSEMTARYKASLLERPCMQPVNQVADLTGGFGVDFYFLAQHKQKALYVERQPELAGLVRHNLSLMGMCTDYMYHGDGMSILQADASSFDVLFLDPARRSNSGGKVVALADCEPDMTRVKDALLAKTRFILLKLSPMLDVSMAISQLPETREVHVVSVQGECKELLMLLEANRTYAKETVPVCCVNLRTNAPDQWYEFTRKQEQDASCRYAKSLGQYLYEPNASLLKAGAFSILTASFPVEKLHPNSHLYTSDQLIADFPGRVFIIREMIPYHARTIRKTLKGVTKAHITVRNFPLTVQEIRKQTGITEGGSDYFFATTLSDATSYLLKTSKVN